MYKNINNCINGKASLKKKKKKSEMLNVSFNASSQPILWLSFPTHVIEAFTTSLTHGDCNNDASYQSQIDQ